MAILYQFYKYWTNLIYRMYNPISNKLELISGHNFTYLEWSHVSGHETHSNRMRWWWGDVPSSKLRQPQQIHNLGLSENRVRQK